METLISPLREQGLQALRAGDLDLAAERLGRAVLADGQDAEAQMYLGVVYCQKGLHAQARRALQTAIELRPHEARYLFNLGVALEGAGDLNGAVAAYRRTLDVNPSYGQARVKLQALAPQTLGSGLGSAGGPAPSSSLSGGEAPWQRGQPATTASAPAGPAGTVSCARCRQWSKPGLSCEWCSAPLKSAPAMPSAPWLQGSYGARLEKLDGASSGPASAPAMSVGDAFGRRLGALLIDQLIVYVLGLIAGGFVGFFLGFAAGVQGKQPLTGAAVLGPILGFVAGFTMAVCYYAGMLSAYGQTLGKMAVGLRVLGPDGGNPGFWRAALRDGLGKPISGIVFCLGYLWMLWDGEQQTWHDKIAGTTVERA